MESDESAGGAAQLVVPQRARGCAAVLCFLAVRSCKASTCALISCREAPVQQPHVQQPHVQQPHVQQLPGATAEEASAVSCPCVAAVPARVAPCVSKALGIPASWRVTAATNPPSRHAFCRSST